MALCAMVAAACFLDASPGRSHGSADPSVIVDLSAIDQAVAARRILSPASTGQRGIVTAPSWPGHLDDGTGRSRALKAPSPATPPLPEPATAAPRPGSAEFYALFPPPPPVPANTHLGESALSEAEDAVSSAGVPLRNSAVMALPVARPVLPVPPRFAAPAPRRPAVGAAPAVVARAVQPVRLVTPRAAPRPALVELAPMAKPVRPQASDGFGQKVRLRLPYPVEDTELSASAMAGLDALVAEVGSNDRVRLRLAAYANAGAGSFGKARRTSLARALAVRGLLIERGIKAGRIDLRALGNTAGAAEADRVDVVVSDK